MIIDAHQHFWKFDPVRHAWIDQTMTTIQKNFLPEELESIYREVGIDGCVSVEADQSENETLYLLDLAEKHSFIKGVVGWIDLRSDSIEERLEYFSGYKKLAGFRNLLQAEEPGRMLEKPFLRGIRALKNYDFTYDILIFPRHLDAAIELVRKFPDQPFIVDHLAKPDIKNKSFEQWASKMKLLAEPENVMCKVSGMVTEADWQKWKPEDMKPYLDYVFKIFGTKRLLFGSDWPVCLLAGSYGRIFSIINDYLDSFSGDERRDVMGLNAVRFYNIGSTKDTKEHEGQK